MDVAYGPCPFAAWGQGFTPWPVGAVINLRGSPQDAYREAQLAAGGPLTGIAASFALLPLADASGLFASLAFTGFFLNLFNLLPTYPLDGGRIAGAISPWFWPLGQVLAGGLGAVDQEADAARAGD
jgi:Zn-dependent protease